MSEMLNNVNTNVERIIAKIDNDFNPDNSDAYVIMFIAPQGDENGSSPIGTPI